MLGILGLSSTAPAAHFKFSNVQIIRGLQIGVHWDQPCISILLEVWIFTGRAPPLDAMIEHALA